MQINSKALAFINCIGELLNYDGINQLKLNFN